MENVSEIFKSKSLAAPKASDPEAAALITARATLAIAAIDEHNAATEQQLKTSAPQLLASAEVFKLALNDWVAQAAKAGKIPQPAAKGATPKV